MDVDYTSTLAPTILVLEIRSYAGDEHYEAHRAPQLGHRARSPRALVSSEAQDRAAHSPLHYLQVSLRLHWQLQLD